MAKLSPVMRTPLTITICLLVAALIAAVITGILIINAGKGNPGTFRYMILLGAKVHGTEPSPILQDRIQAAYTYLSSHEDVICILSGGKATPERISEAQCMFRQLTAMGIDPDRLWLEEQAENTKQNIRFSMALIEEKTGHRPETVGILSSDTHLLRAQLLARRQDVQAYTVSAASTHRSSFWKHFLREIFVVWYYALIGL